MIESCSKKRMILCIALLGGLSVIVIILESRHLHTLEETAADVHESHPILVEKLTKEDLCWKTEPFEIIEECDLCTEKEKIDQNPIVCVAKGKKELLLCKTSQKKIFRSCDKVPWLERRQFWTFELWMSMLGLLSLTSVYIRQKQLDHRMYQKIQKQITSGV